MNTAIDNVVFRFILSGLVNEGKITNEVAEETMKRLSHGEEKNDDNAA